MLSLVQKIKEANDVVILKDVFYRDGSLRDIYVLETTSGDWQKLITFLESADYRVTFGVDGVKRPLPTEFSEIQKHMGEVVQLLSIYVEGVRLNCHFFWIEDIELDLLPNEVDTETKAEAIFRFMMEVGQLLEKEVILTPENGREFVIVRYNPKLNEIEYIPS